jgi:hypothetical protein
MGVENCRFMFILSGNLLHVTRSAGACASRLNKPHRNRRATFFPVAFLPERRRYFQNQAGKIRKAAIFRELSHILATNPIQARL